MAAVTTRSASASPSIHAATHLHATTVGTAAAAAATTASASVAASSATTANSGGGGSAIAHGPVDASLFPLRSIADVVNFFRRSLETWSAKDGGAEPDLTLLSIVAGYVELSLTTGEAASAAAAAVEQQQHLSGGGGAGSGAGGGGGGGGGGGVGLTGSAGLAGQPPEIIKGNTVPFPIVTHELVSGLYKKFQSILSVVEKPKASQHRQATREIIKKVSDVIWHSLIRSSYKDRAHLQNLYSYLSGNKLDCFGVALAVVAGCQLLGYRDVHLAIAEDHAWVVFQYGGGQGAQRHRSETIEVTWHGKGSEDKRGQDISGGIEAASWLYLGGRAVVCDRGMEVAAIVSAINISLTANSDCVEVAELQQQLLWLLYDRGHLKRYPMALGTLGELEEINPLPCAAERRLSSELLYREAIASAREHHADRHVYPYTYQGNYYNRLLRYREAFAAWANAADVIRRYTYNCRDDEEIYKELLDIANELIPHVMKTESSGHSARSILRDSEVFANLLRFYDGICQWEEDSATPIMHIGWAKPLVNNITKFDYDIRSQVVIQLPAADADGCGGGRSGSAGAAASAGGAGGGGKQQQEQHEANNSKKEAAVVAIVVETAEHNNNNTNNSINSPMAAKKSTAEMPTTLADLTAACGEKILNPDFLLQGGGQPFADQKQQHHNNNNNNNNSNNLVADAHNGGGGGEGAPSPATATGEANSAHAQTSTNASEAMRNGSANAATAKAPPVVAVSVPPAAPAGVDAKSEEDPFAFMLKRPVITLYSQKMKGLKDLLLAEKLNTHAISLQLTAPSVASKKVRGSGDKAGHHHYTSNAAANAAAIAASLASAASTVGGGGGGGGAGGGGSGAGVANQAVASAAAAAAASLALADSIAVSRPKRSRRE